MMFWPIHHLSHIVMLLNNLVIPLLLPNITQDFSKYGSGYEYLRCYGFSNTNSGQKKLGITTLWDLCTQSNKFRLG